MKLKRFACLCLLGFGSMAVAQLPTKGAQGTSGSSSQDDCGPAGCTGGGIAGSGGAALRSAAPVVIRTEQTADEDKAGSTSSAAAGRGQTSGTPARAAAADVPDRTSDFQQLVSDTLSHSLPVFGRDLFRNNGVDFSAGPNVSAPADYVVGPGDELRIRTSGKVDIDLRTKVDSGGQIYVPQVGAISVAGVRADQLHEVVQRALAQQFKGFDLSVTLGQIRSIQVFVLGQARRPGVFTISSLSTLVNALFASGGPSSSGSLRDIQVKREGRVITHFDVYQLLLSGDKSADVHLLPGDIIYIPTVGPQIAVDGNVTVPAIYELLGPTTVAGVLQLAGGLTPVAGTSRVTVDRIEDHVRRTVGELALTGREQTVTVQGGDIVRVYPVSARIENAVTLRGSVGNPGRYAFHPGMRISDLIPNRQSLVTRSFYNRQNALDVPPIANPFAPGDVSATSGATTTSVSGATAAAAATTSGISTSGNGEDTDLASHDTEINWNYAVIERLGPADLTTHLLPFALGEAVDNPASAENKTLEAGDVIVVYARKDVNLPSELRARFVRIDGEVKAPGIYRVEENETLRDLVRRAGGLAPHSYLYASQLTRTSVRIAEEAKLKDFVQRESLAALSPVNNAPRLGSALSGGSSAAASPDLALKQAYLSLLASIRPTGRVVLQMRPNGNAVDDVPAFALQDGDHFFVPATPNTVDVLGSVFNQGALRFIDGGRTKDYLSAAGGSMREGDVNHEFIIRADGTLVSRERVHGFSGLHIFPGDTVVVPGRYKAPFSPADLLSLTQTLSTVAFGVVAVALLR